MDSPYNERRIHQRYKVKKNILLYNESTFAEIVNISKGGVYCRFLTDITEQATPVGFIDLINAPEKAYVQSIPCTDLNCHEPQAQQLFASTAIRDCRLQFIQLDCDQHDRLLRFINSVITDPT